MSGFGSKFRTKWEDPYHRLLKILEKDIWETEHPDRTRLIDFLYYALRILSLVRSGFTRNNVFVRSAALCFSSLLALGPLAAILLLAAGFALETVERAKVLELINNFIIFLAPPLKEYFDAQDGNSLVNENLLTTLNGFIESAKSGAFGILGILLLAFIAIQLFMAVEKAFNDIWGVRRGRSWLQRFSSYSFFIVGGGAMTVGILAFYSAGQYVQIVEGLPWGEHILALVRWLAPLLSLLLMIGLLAWFYKYIPNTQVYLYPALSGAFFVSILLVLNKKLSVFYVTYVVNQQSLYGSLGIVPIMMLALYIFWVFILVGGQITYAIQNANYLANQQAWQNTSHSTREILSLAALILIARRFQGCQPAYSATELSRKLRVPGQILNESLSKLTEMGFITLTTIESEKSGLTKRYQPAKPLGTMNLFHFKQALDNYGNSEGKELLLTIDPLIREFNNKSESNYKNDWQHLSLEELLEPAQN